MIDIVFLFCITFQINKTRCWLVSILSFNLSVFANLFPIMKMEIEMRRLEEGRQWFGIYQITIMEIELNCYWLFLFLDMFLPFIHNLFILIIFGEECDFITVYIISGF